MDRLDVAEKLIDEAELAVSVPVRTRGSGDHVVPVVLLSDVRSFRRAVGNSAKAGTRDSDGDGIDDEQLLAHIHEAAASLETRSEDEVQSYQLARDIYNQLSIYEEHPTAFHADLNAFSLEEIEQGGFQAPTPEPVYKHQFGVRLDFNNEVAVPLTSDTTGQPITQFYDDISTN